MIRSLPMAILSVLLVGAAPRAQGNDEPRVPHIAIALRDDGRIYVGESYTGLGKMVDRLRKEGCSENTRITIEIPANTSSNAMTQLGRELTSAGFRRFMFVKPRKAVAEVGEDPFVKRLKESKGIANPPPPDAHP